MPAYEGISIVAEKNSVILDIGHAYTKCGFARESSPRWIIPSTLSYPSSTQAKSIWSYKNAEELSSFLKEFLYTLYFKYLVVNPKDRRVVVVESILCPTLWRNTLAQVLFDHFEVPAIVFVPSHLMALYTLGISSALVLDAGYYESIALPIYENVCILNMCEAVPLAGQAIHRRIEAELMDKAKVQGPKPGESSLGEVLVEPLKENVLEDIKVRTCFVTPLERGHFLQQWYSSRTSTEEQSEKAPQPPLDVQYPLGGDKVVTIPGRLREYAPEVLFELDGEMKSLATILLDSVLKCPIDVRKTLVENVVVMGGTAMLPGFKHRLATELKYLLQDTYYSNRVNVTAFKFHSSPSKDNYTAWLGASIYGSTDVVSSQCITKDQFHQNGCHIPDWSDQGWLNEGGKSLA